MQGNALPPDGGVPAQQPERRAAVERRVQGGQRIWASPAGSLGMWEGIDHEGDCENDGGRKTRYDSSRRCRLGGVHARLLPQLRACGDPQREARTPGYARRASKDGKDGKMQRRQDGKTEKR